MRFFARVRGLVDDRLLGVAGVLVGFWILWVLPRAVRASTFLLPGTDIVFIRGDFFPKVVAWGFIAIGSWLAMVEQARHLRKLPKEPWPAFSTSRKEFVAALAFIAGITAYVAAVNSIGFMVATAGAFLVLSRWLGASWRVAVATAVVGSVVMEVVFGGLLGIPLPGRIISF